MSANDNHTPAGVQAASNRKVTPDELSEGFRQLGLAEGDAVMLHASLEAIGNVDGGAAMVLHRLVRAIGKKGTILAPTFTSVTRHSSTHDNYTKLGCWCEGHETRHLPYIPELQPDKEIGAISYRLCSWPSSRRSTHPAYSFVSVGVRGDELVRESAPLDPLFPVKRFLKHNPIILTIGMGFTSMIEIHLAEEGRVSSKFVRERALTVSSKGPAWVDVVSLGCSQGFSKMSEEMRSGEFKEADIGSAQARVFSMSGLVERARSLLDSDLTELSCDRPACLSCAK